MKRRRGTDEKDQASRKKQKTKPLIAENNNLTNLDLQV